MFKKLIIITLSSLVANSSNASDSLIYNPIIKDIAGRFGTTPAIMVKALVKRGLNPSELAEGTATIPGSAAESIRSAISLFTEERSPKAEAASGAASRKQTSKSKGRQKSTTSHAHVGGKRKGAR